MMQLGSAYVGFRHFCDGWLKVDVNRGEGAVADTYQAVLAGKVSPASGQIIAMGSD